jgi:HK97 family phage major capsid protein
VASVEKETDDSGERSRSIEELDAEIEQRKERLRQIDTEYVGKRFSAESKDEWNRLNSEVDELEESKRELVVRSDRLRVLAEKDEHVEKVVDPFQVQKPRPENIFDLSSIRRDFNDPSVEGRELRDRAKMLIERSQFPHERTRREEIQGHLEVLVEGEENEARIARHLMYTGSPEYRRAFTKYLANQPRSPREEDMLQRAASLTTTAGGFAVPFVLDPSVIPTSNGAINPYRSVASVASISVDEWRGVSSDGITAAFQAEAAAVTDAAPTLAQPTVSTEMARAFVPFSIEIGQDWGSFASEMAAMLSDAKDVLEASKFALGSGTNEPFGVITGATTVYTAANSTSLVVADVYGVHNALPPRFRSRASWTLNNATADRIRQLDTAGGANLWVQNLQLRSAAQASTMTDGRMGADLLGKPAYEATAQSGTFTTGEKIGVIGDFNYYKIIDRIGMTIETIPHIFGAAQGNLPTGQRGLFAYWRVGAKVLHANAFRVLKLA